MTVKTYLECMDCSASLTILPNMQDSKKYVLEACPYCKSEDIELDSVEMLEAEIIEE